jgi:hypothetical protein
MGFTAAKNQPMAAETQQQGLNTPQQRKNMANGKHFLS